MAINCGKYGNCGNYGNYGGYDNYGNYENYVNYGNSGNYGSKGGEKIQSLVHIPIDALALKTKIKKKTGMRFSYIGTKDKKDRVAQFTH